MMKLALVRPPILVFCSLLLYSVCDVLGRRSCEPVADLSERSLEHLLIYQNCVIQIPHSPD
jgi:hypothetical protein